MLKRKIKKIKKKLPIYLDYAATTPLYKKTIKKILLNLRYNFGNYSSKNHIFGWNSEKSIEKARKQVAKLINSKPKEIFWTSGATESNNLALKGSALFYNYKGNHIITIQTEHKSVLDPLKNLEKQGFEITYLKPNKNGLISLKSIKLATKKNTILISVMLVNNEIGVIQPIKKIGNFCYKKNIIFHCDAAQAAGKIKIDVKKLKVNLMSLSGHKVYGPKGVGVLYISSKPKLTRIISQIHGGNQEKGIRSGTLANHQIIGMGESFKIAKKNMKSEFLRIKYLNKKLLHGLKSIEEIYINGDIKKRIPHNLNISFNYIEGESLMMSIKELAISSGSACTSSSLEPSYVLKALGRSNELAHSSIRFSIGKFTSEEDIKYIVNLIKINVNKLRKLSPLWEMYKDGINVENIKWI